MSMTLPCDANLKLRSTYSFACALTFHSKKKNTRKHTLSLSGRACLHLRSTDALTTCPPTNYSHSLLLSLSVLSAALSGFHARWHLELVNSFSGSTHRLVCRTWLCAEVVARPIAAQHSYNIHVHCLCVRVCAYLHMFRQWVSVWEWAWVSVCGICDYMG